MTLQEIKKSAEDINKISLYARLTDKFGDNGLISLIQGTISKDLVEIDLWLMSCRVFKRTLEHSLFYTFLKEAKNRGIKTVIGKYLPTKKNHIVSGLYEEIGFNFIKESDGIKIFKMDIQNLEIPTNSNITIEGRK